MMMDVKDEKRGTEIIYVRGIQGHRQRELIMQQLGGYYRCR